MEFVTVKPEVYEEAVKGRISVKRSPLLEALLAGEAVFIATPNRVEAAKTESRLGQYYGTAKNHGYKFIKRKVVHEGKEGFMCRFVKDDDTEE